MTVLGIEIGGYAILLMSIMNNAVTGWMVLLSPRRLRAKYTHRTNLRFMLCVFRDCIELMVPETAIGS